MIEVLKEIAYSFKSLFGLSTISKVTSLNQLPKYKAGSSFLFIVGKHRTLINVRNERHCKKCYFRHYGCRNIPCHTNNVWFDGVMDKI